VCFVCFSFVSLLFGNRGLMAREDWEKLGFFQEFDAEVKAKRNREREEKGFVAGGNRR
jgi:hypothetical protein